jgi:hypothetical protein
VKTVFGSFDSNIYNLRLLAVEALSKFVRLVAEHQWETIALNLTGIVVCIVPAIESHEQNIFLKQHPSVKRTHDVAVNLLEYLTRGTVGKNLAKSFIEIPFLPLSSSLEKVRQSLRSNGVDFDNLLLVSSVTEDAISEGQDLSLGSKLSSTTSPNSDKMTALQKRLAMVCALLDNENSNVRRVVLKHTTDLLRANRELFQALVENEGSTSMKRFLTVDYRESKPTTLSTGSSKGEKSKYLLLCFWIRWAYFPFVHC